MNRTYDSLFTVGDKVSLTFPGNGLLKNATVIKVSFDYANNFYDVEVPYDYYENEVAEKTVKGTARIHGLKEWHLRQAAEPMKIEEDMVRFAEWILEEGFTMNLKGDDGEILRLGEEQMFMTVKDIFNEWNGKQNP